MRFSDKSSEKQNLKEVNGRSSQDMFHSNIGSTMGEFAANVSRVVIDDPGTLVSYSIPRKDQ